MGFFSDLWDGIKSVGSIVKRVVKTVYQVITNEKTVDVYDRLEVLINKQQQPVPVGSQSAPNFYGALAQTDIEKKLETHDQKFISHENKIDFTAKMLTVQNEFSRLRLSAELIDRSMSNIKIHASSLSVHFQNMRNINGLVDDVNSLRYAVKVIISTMNHNANLLDGNGLAVQRISGVDIEKKDGAISLVSAYDTFDKTRALLVDEVRALSKLASVHLKDIDNLKLRAADLGGELACSIIDFLDREVVPVVKRAEKAGLILRSEVSQIPVAIRDEDGRFVFEDGRIKLAAGESV